MKVEKNKDKRCPIGMNGSQKESVNDVLVNVVDISEDKSSIDTEVYDQDDPRDDLHPPNKT